MKSFVKKHCNFCGEPMQEAATVCKQCGWDRSQDGAPSADPADQKARVGVAAGLVVAYYVMFSLVSGASADARPARPARSATPALAAANPAPEYAPVSGEPVVLGALPPTLPAGAAVTSKPGKPLTIKVADAKSASIEPRDALQYAFELPETDQKCQLVGQTHGVGGFDGRLEVFLLTDDEYLFWHANTAAVPHSSWETVRGSEATLAYRLPAPGIYHLVISNVMSPRQARVEVKAQVKCAK
jgi:hypothetical protein